MTVGRICSRVVASASSQETVRVAAKRMAENDVGTLVVLEGNKGSRVVGMLTDRDVTVRCVAADLDPDRTPVASIMTKPVHFVEEQAPVEEAIDKMAKVGTRRLVVLATGGGLAGVLSLDDVLDLLTREVESIGGLLAKQQRMVPA